MRGSQAKKGWMPLRDKRSLALTVSVLLHHWTSPLPSANIWPATLSKTFLDFPLNCKLSLVKSSWLCLLSGKEEKSTITISPQSCLFADLSLLADYLTSNPNSLITACEGAVATWQDRRGWKAVQVWVLARVRTAVGVDFGPVWRRNSLLR